MTVTDVSSSGLRRAASAVVPDAGKRAIDKVRSRRFLRRIAPINEEYVGRYGLEVRRGPFAGMRYLPGQEHISGHLIAKLIGSYERQLYPWMLDEWIAHEPELVIDVGCAEGFYAVGLARALPAARVLAYDTLERAQGECAELARLNGVEDRVVIGGLCTPQMLAELAPAKVALLSDCEGYERTLLDPRLAPNLRGWSIIVEQHDNIEPGVSETIARRFSESHEIEVIHYEHPDSMVLPELDWLDESARRLVLRERPLPMSWALLRPRVSG
jgi:hypothetical protein